MYKIIKSALLAIFIASNLFFTFSLNAANKSSVPSQQPISLPSESELKKITKTKEGKVKVKIVKKTDGGKEIDNQPDVKMTKEQEKNFNECKKEVEKTRTPKYKNKPTPCVKIPTETGEFTDQSYTILWENVNQNIEKFDGKDMSKESPIEDYLNDAEIVSEEVLSSSSSSIARNDSSSSVNTFSSSQNSLIA